MITTIPEAVNHQALLAALSAIRVEAESRQEDVQGLAAWSAETANRLKDMGEELKALNVDNVTIGNLHAVADSVAGQAAAAARYRDLTDQTVGQAEAAARTAHRNHGRIEEAVHDAPVEMANGSFYRAE